MVSAPAFQAGYAGSIPVTRSKIVDIADATELVKSALTRAPWPGYVGSSPALHTIVYNRHSP